LKVGVLGQGFLGRSISAELLNRGFEVVSLSKTQQAEGAWINFVSLNDAREAFMDVTHVFIASGNSNPAQITLAEELNRTRNVVLGLPISPQTQLIYLSSGAVYGNCEMPKSELDSALPTTVYGKIKLQTEASLAEITRNLTILRIGNVYSSENPIGIFKVIRESLLNSQAIPIFGLPTDARDYLGINDFINMILKLLSDTAPNNIFNLGCGSSITLSEIASLIREVYNLDRHKINWCSPRSTDTRITSLNCEKVYSKLNLEVKSHSDNLQSMHQYLSCLAKV
jgi:nucleoside-diphosphate-sugar epimerase